MLFAKLNEYPCAMLSTSGKILKRLAVFDFDHTICEHNTDIIVRDLLDKTLITPEIRNIMRTCGWIPYMQRILRMMHQQKIMPGEIRSAIRGIPEVPGIKSCIESMAGNNFHIIIISDSNSEFIKTWNDYNDIGQFIHTTFTNPAEFTDNGLLVVHPFHNQTQCKLSSRNLCKGKILDDFLTKQSDEANTEYEKIFYIGDGKNDVCPMLRLAANGYACPREGFTCYIELTTAISSLTEPYAAKILKWNTGNHLRDMIWKELLITL